MKSSQAQTSEKVQIQDESPLLQPVVYKLQNQRF